MPASAWFLLAVSTLISLLAVAIAWTSPPRSNAGKLKRLEMDLVELADLIESQGNSIKKLYARSSTRDAREAKRENGSAPTDPMDRLPGESGEQWKARMGRTLFTKRSV